MSFDFSEINKFVGMIEKLTDREIVILGEVFFQRGLTKDKSEFIKTIIEIRDYNKK